MNFRKEHIIYTLMWIVLYISPVMGLYMRMSGDPDIDFSWNEILNAWSFNTVWLALFAIHNFLLAPLLIVKRRTVAYTLLSLTLLAVAMATLWATRPNADDPMMHRHMRQIEARHAPVGKDGPRRRDHMFPRRPPEFRPAGFVPMFGPGELVTALGGLMLMGMNLGVKLYFKSQDDQKALGLIEKHNLERQLEYLKYQVNPHFFMNTLNNIHALVDIDPERAKTTIVELSKMMRYLLYEGNNKLIPLSHEVQFLRNYVQLMSLRYTNRVSIRLDTPDGMPDLMLPPLLLIIFVENAFKHGISYNMESFVDISLGVKAGRLLFRCSNSRPSRPDGDGQKGGMGLRNVRMRLDLLFANDYTLDIMEEDTTYDVSLDIPLGHTPPAEVKPKEQHS